MSAQPMQIEGYAEPDALSPAVLTKYDSAGRFANRALYAVLKRCHPGISTMDLCIYGDQLIQEFTQPIYKTVERGIAEPTTVNINNGLSGYSPMESPYVLQAGDVIKVSLGVHIDGYTAKVCHTTVITPDQPQGPLLEKPADAIIAAYYATEAVVQLLTQASLSNVVNAGSIRQTVEASAETFNVKVVEGSRVRRIKRYLIGQARVEEDALGADQPKQVEWVRHIPGTQTHEDPEFIVEQGEAWLVDIAMSTGSGQVKEHISLRPTIFARDVTVNYNLKLKAAQATLREIESTKSVYPFCLRSLSDQRIARMGITECRNKGVVTEYQVVVAHPKDILARQAVTVLLNKSASHDAIRLTGGAIFRPPLVTSKYEVEEGSQLAMLLQRASASKIKELSSPAVDAELKQSSADAMQV